MWRRSTGRRDPPPTSPTYTPGPRCTSPARAGSGSTQRRDCSPEKVTSRCRRRPIPSRRRRSRARPSRARPRWTSPTSSPACTRIPASRCPTPRQRGARSARSVPASTSGSPPGAGGRRLTVGGEPTFVSIDNQVDPEWTTDADGPHKRERASALAARLKKLWAPLGLVQRSDGKWYPGEPLPRWEIGLHWRPDAEPLWTDEALLADPWQSGVEHPMIAPDVGQQVLGAIADGLGLPASQVRPAYEDALGRLAGAVRQPEGEPVAAADDLEADAADARAALLSRLEESVTEPAAYVLPLHRRDDDSGWASADWQLRRGRIVLLGGDSPGGLRLPLKSISWHPPRPSYEADPLVRHGDLAVDPQPDDAVVDEDESVPTTAMVVEIRKGLLYIYMPPTEELEHFVDLVTRIEAAAAKADCPLVIEGYGPPPDPRLTSMSITPDPGVIEVNV